MSNMQFQELDHNTLDYISEEISNKFNYNNIIDLCLELLEKNLYSKEKELLYELLEKITLICDKSSEIIDKIILKIPSLINLISDSWIRSEGFLMLEKISVFRPNALIDLIESIENCLSDEDHNIREISIVIIGNLILNLHIDRENLFHCLMRSMEDNLWRIRVRSLEIFRKIIKADRMEDKYFNKFVEIISKLVSDEDEEVQSVAIEILLEINKEINSQLLLKINSKFLISDWDTQEKGIWFIGEVGAVDFSSISLIMNKLVEMLKSSNLMVQTKIIDAFVKIGRKFTDEIIQIIFDNILDDNEDLYESLLEIFLYLGIEQSDRVFRNIFEKLEAPENKKIRIFIEDCMEKYKIEILDKIEEAVAKYLLVELTNLDWRIRLNKIRVLGDLNYILKEKGIAVWSYMKLEELLEEESDPDVTKAINNSLAKIKNCFDEIELITQEIIQDQKIMYKNIERLQKIPEDLRKSILKLLEKNEFREASISLEENINKSVIKIEKFSEKIRDYKYKRLALDLIEDWSYSRLDLLEQISDLKIYILEKIEEARSNYVKILRGIIEKKMARITVLKSEIEFLVDLNNEIKELILSGQDKKAKKKLDYLAYIRDKIFRLESEIGQIWIENLDFKEDLKDITVFWVQVKIEAQQLLYTISYNLKDLQTFMENEKESKGKMKNDLSFELLLNEFQNLISQSSKNVNDQFERFKIITSPVMDEIKKGAFNNAENLLNLTISQTNTSIDEFNNQIMKLYSQLDMKESDLEHSALIRKYLNDWQEIKDSLIEKSNEFYEEASRQIFISRIDAMQKFLNPIPIKLIANKLKSTENLILERIFTLMEMGLMEGKIKNNNLFLPEDFPEFDKILYISRKIEVVGSTIKFMVRLENKTNEFIHDLNLLFSNPNFLTLKTERSNLKYTEIKDFEPGAVQIFKWNLNISKNEGNDSISNIEKTHRIGEIRLLVRYKDGFGVDRELDKRLDVLV